MAQCNSICIQFRSDLGTYRYTTGQKWCSYCARFLETEKINCPCCSTKLRSSRRCKTK